VIKGDFRCHAIGPNDFVVDDVYTIEVRVPPGFPRALPQVFETGGRIPMSFHHLENGALCLGAPTALRLAIRRSPTIGGFLDDIVRPYLYAHAYHERFGRMPFGELPHGARGLKSDLLRLFRMPVGADVLYVLHLAGLRRRVANKKTCPCGGGRRLGQCHNASINEGRRRLGRGWFRKQAAFIRHHYGRQ
jgi:hypothetical protein